MSSRRLAFDASVLLMCINACHGKQLLSQAS